VGARRLLVSDLDGTLLGDPDALARFRLWVTSRRSSLALAYASGRHRDSIQAVIESDGLPGPDAVISAVGTAVHGPNGEPWPGWLEQFGHHPADRVREVLRAVRGLELQAPVNQTPVKASYDVPGLGDATLDRIRIMLDAAGLPSRLVYSGGLHLDVIPAGAGKGAAARFVADMLGIGPGDVLAFGDSGNDLDLLSAGFRGTMVANAQPELRSAIGPDVYQSPYPFADGVLDGIRHWLDP
jgi:sucrose-6F-phosphate phosphohydrolase